MKKSILFLLVLLTVISLSTRTGKSYVRSPISSGPARGTALAWNLSNPGTTKVVSGEITYNLNPTGSDNLPFSQVEQALMASFQAWEDIPTSAIAFRRGPDTSSTTGGNDDFLQLFWIENSTTTPDGLNLTGALAVSRTTAFSSGTRAGEILDGSLVFNGNEYQWGVNGAANLADIGEVATHEIGHLIGLSHTAIGGATMFPRSGEGRTSSRSLEQDDILAASSAYPAGDFLTSRGTLAGRVSDGANPIFGAHIAAVDGNGNVVSGALSQPDGSYSIQGLPPGDYTVYAEPLDPNAGNFYSKSDLSDFYSTANLDFLTTQDFQVSIGAGQQSPLDIQVTRGTPALDGYIVFDERNAAFVNVSTTVFLGESDVTVGIAGPGLPQLGAPLSISGPGITITSQRFVTTTTGLTAVLAQINVSPTAPLGARNIIVSNGSQRTIVTGALELQLPGSPAAPAVASAANFGTLVAPESIASVFGLNLGTITQNAASTPLPTSIGGSTVVIRDAAGTERLAPLFFSSPFQINFLVPAGTALGQATIAINNGSGGTSTSGFQVMQSAPGLFSSNSTGGGLAAALIVRVRNNVQTFEPIAQPGGAPIPIDLGPPGDQVFLILYATGVRGGGFPACTIGGVNSQIVFAGPQGSLLGLDQVNVLLDRSLGGQGATHNILLSQDGISSNTVTVVVQ
jgi:uncharacterized protein (TIGR03437 family)